MEWKFKKGKYVIEKDGVFFSLYPGQIYELSRVLDKIKDERVKKLLNCQ